MIANDLSFLRINHSDAVICSAGAIDMEPQHFMVALRGTPKRRKI